MKTSSELVAEAKAKIENLSPAEVASELADKLVSQKGESEMATIARALTITRRAPLPGLRAARNWAVAFRRWVLLGQLGPDDEREISRATGGRC